MFEFSFFLIVSLFIVKMSWRSLRNWRSHGFYRFFAFELIVVLILLNVDVWFDNLFTARQLVASLLLCLSLFLAIHGFYLLKALGKPLGRVENSSNWGYENTEFLVTVGAYRYIRHPLYTSLLLLGWGTFLKDPSILGGLLALAMSAFLVATAKTEETENLDRFGESYTAYIKSSKMFVPFLF